jgi:hypothetical protein
MSGRLHAPVALPPGEILPYPLDRKTAGWAPEAAWKIWKSENTLRYRGSNSDPLVLQPVSQYTRKLTMPVISSIDENTITILEILISIFIGPT